MGEAKPIRRYWIAILIVALIALITAGLACYKSWWLNPSNISENLGKISENRREINKNKEDIGALRERIEDHEGRIRKLEVKMGNLTSEVIIPIVNETINKIVPPMVNSTVSRAMNRTIPQLIRELRGYTDRAVMGNATTLRNYVDENISKNCSALKRIICEVNSTLRGYVDKSINNTASRLRANMTELREGLKEYIDKTMKGNLTSLKNYMDNSLRGNYSALRNYIDKNVSDLNEKISNITSKLARTEGEIRKLRGNVTKVSESLNRTATVLNGKLVELKHYIDKSIRSNCTELKSDITELRKELSNVDRNIISNVTKLEGYLKGNITRLRKLESTLGMIIKIADEGANLSKVLSPLISSINDTATRNALGNLTSMIADIFRKISKLAHGEGLTFQVSRIGNAYLYLTEASIELRGLTLKYPNLPEIREVLKLIEGARNELIGG